MYPADPSRKRRYLPILEMDLRFSGRPFASTAGNGTSSRLKRAPNLSSRKWGTLIRKYVSAPMVILIKKLNQVLRGWASYHRHVVSSEAFSRIDTYVFEELWRMLRKRHPRKSAKWLIKEYWSNTERKHIFAVKSKTPKGIEKVYQVVRICTIGIKRHIKIKAAANPYCPEFARYFWNHINNKESKLLPILSAREFREQFAQRS